METTSFLKGFPCGYQWICILKLIACLCFINVFTSNAVARRPTKTEQHDDSKKAIINCFPDNFSPATYNVTEK
jgi:hypothetical protein